MNASELRIGNWIRQTNIINYKYNHLDQNDLKFHPDRLFQIEKHAVLIVFETYCYQPIPLTEEWLIKFGFERLEYTYHLNGFNIDLEFKYCMIDGDGYCVYEGYCNPLKHVHQLQNLYFALTGEELKSTN